MNDRRITNVRRNDDGEIVALCNPGKEWSPVYKDTAIRHLKTGMIDYFVAEADYISYLKVVEGSDGEDLSSTPDPGSSNNLENLPEAEAAGVS